MSASAGTAALHTEGLSKAFGGFKANTDVSLSWYQRCDEMRALEGLLAPPRRNEMTFDGPVLLPAADAGDEVSRDEIRDWAVQRFGDWNGLIEALQHDDPAALRSQYLHHRAKVADELRALERFWAAPAA